ncbi:PolC-type DNA polymerase III [Mycoplasma sp. SG1]|uniref:PolC-type DNA polymerase III n=1 Tax=Mycoplasma sp. SG1 TaxID=2810348 RepID=UPI0020250DD9|nr:PolC-type DNA polymerase III [Mycoplasma sp. SG1]URM53213.1 PolC-type DNA polymerase III [Mycoplasma sp. SG1]
MLDDTEKLDPRIKNFFLYFKYQPSPEEINIWEKFQFETIEIKDNTIQIVFKVFHYFSYESIKNFIENLKLQNIDIICNYQINTQFTKDFKSDLKLKFSSFKFLDFKHKKDKDLFQINFSSQDDLINFQKILNSDFDQYLIGHYGWEYFLNSKPFVENKDLSESNTTLTETKSSEKVNQGSNKEMIEEKYNHVKLAQPKKKILSNGEKYSFQNRFINPLIIDEKKTKNDSDNSQSNPNLIFQSSKIVTKNSNTLRFEKISDVLSNVHENEQFFLTGTVTDLQETTPKDWTIFQFYLNDGTERLCFKKFFKTSSSHSTFFNKFKKLQNDDYIVVDSTYRHDSYLKQECGFLKDFEILQKKPKVKKKYSKYHLKRTELSVHTNMSMMDGVNKVEEYLERAVEYDLDGLAITDNNSVQNFPSAYYWKLKNKPQFKLIYGLSLNVIPKVPDIFINQKIEEFNFKKIKQFIVFDLETTGFYASVNEIIEFAGIKIVDGKIVDKLEIFLKPSQPINDFIQNLTGISNEMLKDGYDPKSGILKIKEFIGDYLLVAHNALFDYSFLQSYYLKYLDDVLSNLVLDTYSLARFILVDKKKFSLKSLAGYFKIKYLENSPSLEKSNDNSGPTTNAHRAGYDAEVLYACFLKLLELLENNGLNDFKDICQIKIDDNDNRSVNLLKYYETTRGWPINIYVKNQAGIEKLYELLSLASTDYCFKRPKIFFENIEKMKEHFILTSCDFRSPVFNSVIQNNFSDFKKFALNYDYLELNPPRAYLNFIGDNKFKSITLIQDIIKTFIKWAKKINKPVIVTSNCFYLDEEDYSVRDLLIKNYKNKSWTHYLKSYDNDQKSPQAHLYETKKLVDQFDFLNDKDLVEEIIFINPKKISDQISNDLIPIKSKLYPVVIDENASNLIKKICYRKLEKIYGKNPDKLIIFRLEEELKIIIRNDYANIFLISNLIVNKSLKDKYLVGSRGSIGSSFVGFLLNITEVNPLPAHYVCPSCHYHHFVDKNIDSGFDLDIIPCPKCSNQMVGDGHNIFFETFLGIDGNKVPDIDLNFASSYQNKIHQFVVDLFSPKQVFRAGTISKIQDKLAYSYFMEYAENNPEKVYQLNKSLIIKKLTGIKKTSSQHPGGFVIIPKGMNINQFTPVCYPGDDRKADFKITHFDIDVIHDILLKLDLLGHLDPEVISIMTKLVNKSALLNQISFHDKKILSLFRSTEALGYKIKGLVNDSIGVIGAPEFGTNFVRKMLLDGKPTKFSDLVRISGLSHGTNVWINNAKNLILKKNHKLKDVVACRDDIMINLIDAGVNRNLAFEIMESIRKGKGLNADYEHILKEAKIPSWYIESCKKITYLFPKAHATAYVMMAWRILWFKIYYPLEYYSVYFSVRCTHFEPEFLILKDPFLIKKRLNEIKAIDEKRQTSEEKDLITSYESALEFIARGFSFEQVNLQKSDAYKFIIDHERNSLILPFRSIKGLGDIVGKKIVAFRKSNPDFNHQLFKEAKILNQTQLKIFKNLNIIND